MSTVIPKRRVYDGDVVNAEDWNSLIDDFYRTVGELNEHNLSSGFLTQLSRADDYDASVAWRIASASNGGNTTDVNEVIGGQPSGVSGALIFQETELWMTIWEFQWISTERADIYGIANVQASNVINRSWTTPAENQGLDEFLYLDAMNIKLGWILDGVLPSEHVRGAMDLGAAGINMERGFGGEFNAQDVSALFKSVRPGAHTMRLVVLRAEMPDEVTEALRKVIVSLWEAFIWEIRR